MACVSGKGITFAEFNVLSSLIWLIAHPKSWWRRWEETHAGTSQDGRGGTAWGGGEKPLHSG